MPNSTPSNISYEDALAVIDKLQALRETLSPGERVFLDQIFEYFVTKVSAEPRVEEILADLPEGAALLNDVAGFVLEPAPPCDLIPQTLVQPLLVCTPTCPPTTPGVVTE